MAIFSFSTTVFTALGLSLPFLAMSASTSVPSDQDSELVKAILDGDPAAYRGIVERYQGRIYNVIFGMVRNREDAKELAQDAFVKAYKNLHTYRLESKFYTWLCRIAINLSIDWLRKMKLRRTSEYNDEAATKDSGGGLFDGHKKENPHSSAVNKEIYGRIIEEVEKLPDDQKQAIVLREIDGLSYREIAEIMGIPEGTVMSRLYYARKKLQQTLKDLRD